MTKWISVKHKLPDNAKRCLVWVKGIYNEPVIAWHYSGEFYPNQHNDETMKKWVTHWMPLPRPPAAATSEGERG